MVDLDELVAQLPAKRVSAGVLLTDPSGRVLLVDPTYKDGWEIPGGIVEEGEAPRAAARREVQEELGITLEPGELLVVHWEDRGRLPGDFLAFLFDGGTTTRTGFDLPPDELRASRFVDPEAIGDLLQPGAARRLTAAIEARRTGSATYLER